MKRYQCIKNVIIPASLGFEAYIAFKSGKVYDEYINDSWAEFTDELGIVHIITPELLENFKEVTTLEKPQPKKTVGTGCAIVIVTILTVLALIFFR